MESNFIYQRKYWNELTEVRYSIYYLSFYKGYYEKIDRIIKLILALSSSASIGSWVIWNKYGMIWASIIALSQVLHTVKPFFPLEKK